MVHDTIHYMGYMVELNTLLRPPANFDFSSLSVGTLYHVTLERQRAFPLRIALLVVDQHWNFYGYAQAISLNVENGTSAITFKMLTLFTKEEQDLYRKKFIEAAQQTGEV